MSCMSDEVTNMIKVIRQATALMVPAAFGAAVIDILIIVSSYPI